MECAMDDYDNGCPDCMCCTYCGAGESNDCPTSSIGDSTCPCTCD